MMIGALYAEYLPKLRTHVFIDDLAHECQNRDLRRVVDRIFLPNVVHKMLIPIASF